MYQVTIFQREIGPALRVSKYYKRVARDAASYTVDVKTMRGVVNIVHSAMGQLEIAGIDPLYFHSKHYGRVVDQTADRRLYMIWEEVF